MRESARFPDLEHAMADVLRSARIKRKLTSAQLAERMRCSRTYISKVESGYCTPGLPSLARFATALGTPAWNLLRNAEARLEQPLKTVTEVRAEEDKQFEAVLASRAAEKAKMPPVYVGQVSDDHASKNPAA